MERFHGPFLTKYLRLKTCNACLTVYENEINKFVCFIWSERTISWKENRCLTFFGVSSSSGAWNRYLPAVLFVRIVLLQQAFGSIVQVNDHV